MENKGLGVSPVKRVNFICTNAYKPCIRLIIRCCRWNLHAVAVKWHTLPQVDGYGMLGMKTCVIIKVHLRSSDLRICWFPCAEEHSGIAIAEMIVLKQAAPAPDTVEACPQWAQGNFHFVSSGTEFGAVMTRSLLVPYTDNLKLVRVVYVMLH